MKIRPQSELAHVQNKTLALNQAESVSRGRFDAALVQAAQGVRDSEGDAYSGLTPQARQALSEALENLSGKNLSQLKDLASDPEALAALLSGLTQGQALSTSEAARVVKLLAMALPRIMQVKSKSPEQSASSAGGAKGTQGPKQDIFTALGIPATGVSSPQGENGAASGSFAEVLNGANSGMAGIQGGQAYASLFGSGAAGAPASGRDASEPAGVFQGGSGAVLPVSVNAGASAAGAAAGQGVFAANSPAGAVQSSEADGNGRPNSGFSPAGQVQADGQAASGNGAGPRGVQADGADAEFPLMLDLDVQIVDPGQALGAQPGTQVTLKGDNSWVYPESAQTQAPRQSQPQVAAQTQEGQGAAGSQAPALAPRDTTAEGGLPVFGQLVPGTPGTPSELEGVQGQDGPLSSATGTGAKGPDLSALEEDLSLAAGDAPGVPGDGGPLPSGTGPSASGAQGSGSQAQASFQMLGQAPGVLTQGQAPAGQGNGGTAGRGTGQTRGSLPAAGASGQAQNFGAALAAVGQDAGQGNGNTQAGPGQSRGAWAPGSPVPAGIAQAVNQALTQASPATPGRLSIQLTPANLGSVQVELVLADGKLTAHLVAGQQDVRDALARDLPGFKAGLESHGIVVNEVSVALGADPGRDQNPSRQAPDPWRAFATTASREAADTAVSAGWGSYGENAAGTSQGFSALA